MDPGTIRALQSIGVQEGWKCLEVGGGAGSIAAWLASKVAPTGNVVATDLQTSFLEAKNLPGLSVERHDIAVDSLEENHFDLIHSRAVLEHLPDREVALDKMVAALKPGGWLLLECHDFNSLQHIAGGNPEAFEIAVEGMLDVMTKAGFDSRYGRHVGHALAGKGLKNVNTEARAYELGGDRPLTGALTLSLRRLADSICDSKQMDREVLDNLLNGLENGEVLGMSPMIVAAWGQRTQ